MPQTDAQRHFSLSLIEGGPVSNSTPAQAVMVFDEVCHLFSPFEMDASKVRPADKGTIEALVVVGICHNQGKIT